MGRLIRYVDRSVYVRRQQLFVENNGYVLEQLSATWHKRSWRWMGNRWSVAQPRFEQSYSPGLLALSWCWLIVCFH